MTAQPDHTPLRRFVGTFHKTGTVLFKTILEKAEASGLLHLWQMSQPEPALWDIGFDDHARFMWPAPNPDPDQARHVVCIRDPRDVVVSSAYYHLRSNEAWLHVPRPELDGRGYQETLVSLPDMQARFRFEMRHAGGDTIRAMLRLPLGLPSLHVTRLEDLSQDTELRAFEAVFRHLGYEGEKLAQLMTVAFQHSQFSGGASVPTHIRSSKAAQHLHEFDDETRACFDTLYPGAAELLGYDGTS